jgi:DNA (cytosine-5)-methyltransferase 1
MDTSFVSVTDMFCGAGGSTTGAVQAGAQVRLAMNHWPRAIETHHTNYPHVEHVLTDVSLTDPRRYPSTTILIASPECTNHSLSKGVRRKGQAQLGLWEQKPPDPAQERSRCTMWDPLRFAEYHQYQIIILENVVEARSWRLWEAWLHGWQALDYRWQIVYFNSMFAHPTPQSRDRMYVVLWKRKNRAPDLRITPRASCPRCEKEVEAVQSWKNPAKPWGKYGKNRQYVYCCPSCATVVTPYYYCAANAIDWRIPTTRIGDRSRPLKEKTLRRIELGLRRWRGEAFRVQVNKTPDRVRAVSTETFPTQTADNGLALVQPPFLLTLSHDSGDERRVIGLARPFLIELRRYASARRLTDPLATMCAGGEHHALIVPPFILDHMQEDRVRAITEPDPLSTIVAQGNHQSVVIPPAWLLSYYQNGQMAPVETPMPTVTTLERHALVTSSEGEKIRIEDCGFRMLEPHEIQAAMAFPPEYVVLGNRREKIRQLGNAVTPPVMKLLMQRCLASLA